MTKYINDYLMELKSDKCSYDNFKKIITYSKKYLFSLNSRFDSETTDDIINTSIMYWIRYDKFDESVSKPITYYTKILFNSYLQKINKSIKEKEIFTSYDTMENIDHLPEMAFDENENEFLQLDTKSIELYIETNYPILYKYTYKNYSYKEIADETGFKLQYIKNRIRLNKKQLYDYYNPNSNKNPFSNNLYER